MPGESKKISELESASSLNNGDLLELASVNALSETGYSSKKTTIADVANKIATLNPQAQADWTEADNTDPSYIQNKPTLATVATSGDYDDLTNKPTIPAAQVNSDWNSVSGVSQILNKPTLGTAASKNTGVANGVAELDANGLVPTSQLPAYVDDVLEYASQSAFPATGETGKIYVALDTNLTYRWGGTEYVEISPSLALGETSSTAYAGNKGKANADAISAIQSTLSGLATVATTGDYDDLLDKPTIPTVNNATVTFTQGGTPKGSITLNQAADATIALDAGGGGSGGHTILDDEGTSLTQRNDLQFKGAYSVDNHTDQITEVNVVREMTKAEFDLLTADEKVGIINVTDEGGSGGSSYYEEVLWNNTSGAEFYPQSPQTITLANGIDNYDCLAFEYSNNASRDYRTETIIPVSMIDKTGNNYFSVVCMGSNTEDCPSVKYIDNTNLAFWGYSSSRHLFVYKIIGIKYGSSNRHNYSTNEQAVGTWIDGSTIYEQSFAITNQNISTGWTVLVSGLFIDTLISGEVSISGGGYNYTWNALYYQNGNIAIYNFLGGAILSASGYLTIRYTKASA